MGSHRLSVASPSAWDWRDAVAVVILILICWATRLPTMNSVAMNPDESQYEATAAYLLAADLSAFSIPHTSPGTYVFYKAIAWLFGPYAMLEVRIFVLLLVVGISVLTYALVREESSRWGGMAAGLIVVWWSIYFEGLTANREWFCGALLVAGAFSLLRGLGRRGGTRADLELLTAGMLCGAALWFKLHAGLLVLPPVGLCLWLAWVGEDRRGMLRALSLYTLGGLLITLIGMLPFALVGSLDSFLRSIVIDLFGYASAVDPGGVQEWSIAGRFFTRIPGRPLLLAAYGFAGLTFGTMVYRLVTRRETPVPLVGSPLAVLFALNLGTAIVTISIGGRFFGHYYLFLVTPVAILFGLATGLLTAPERGTRLPLVAAWVYLGLLLLTRVLDWPEVLKAGEIVYLIILGVLVVFGLSRPPVRLGRAVAGILVLEIVFLGMHATSLVSPRSSRHPGHEFSSLSAELIDRSEPTDRLFVWGWAPEIYSLTRLTPASQFIISMYLVNDTRADPKSYAIDPHYERQLMDELHSVAPRYVVDASARSWTMVASGDPRLYSLQRYPDFELNHYLSQYYRRVGRFDDCTVYERRSPSGPSP